MKIGDLVKPRIKNGLMTEEDFNSIGIIIRVLDLGSGRKRNSYEVLWNRESDNLFNWHTDNGLELVK